MIERIFNVRERGSSVRVELVAGLTTFLTMAYIIFVNPAILGDAGMPKGAVFVPERHDRLPRQAACVLRLHAERLAAPGFSSPAQSSATNSAGLCRWRPDRDLCGQGRRRKPAPTAQA